MGNALQDQLLKAGLVNKKKLQENAQQQRKQTKQQGKQSKKAKKQAAANQTAQQQQALQEKQTRDRELNQQKQAELQVKERVAQITQLIEQNKIDYNTGDTAYHFVHANVVKKLYVTPEVQQQLADGKVLISAYLDSYALISPALAEKIHARDADWFIAQPDTNSEATEEDDPYAAYQIPDDLVW